MDELVALGVRGIESLLDLQKQTIAGIPGQQLQF